MIKHFLSALSFLVLQTVSFAQTAQSSPSVKSLVRSNHQVPFLPYKNGGFRLLADSAATGGRWSVAEITEQPGFKTPLHRHNTWDESFYVLEGTMTATIGDSIYHLPAGSYLQIPKGTPHGQANFGTVPLKLLLLMQPSGFERHLLDRVELYKILKPEDPSYARHGDSLRRKNVRLIEGLGEWADEKNIPGFERQVRAMEQQQRQSNNAAQKKAD